MLVVMLSLVRKVWEVSAVTPVVETFPRLVLAPVVLSLSEGLVVPSV